MTAGHWNKLVLMFSLYIFILHVISCLITVNAETVYEAIKNHPNLTKFVEHVDKDTITKIWLQERTATVFAPTNEAFDRLPRSALTDSLGPYHVVGATVAKGKFPFSMSSTKTIAAPLIFTFRDPHPEAPGLLPHAPHSHGAIGLREYFVNNAKIVWEKEGYRGTQNTEQILYIIDEVMEPFVPSAGISPTANEFLQRRITYSNEGTYPSSVFADHVVNFGLESLFDRPGNNTFFLPLISSSDSWRVRNLDGDIVKAHVIPNRALYFRTIEGNTEYRTAAWNDKTQVGIALPISPEIAANLSTRAASRIQSRTHKSENRNHHIGIVRTSIVKANIPVRNGVVHFIDKPFMVIDISVWDFIDNNREGQISRFVELLQKSNRLHTARDTGRTLTIFAPNNAAFDKIDPAKLNAILNDTDKLNDLIALHIVDGYSVNTETVKSGKYLELPSSDNRRNVYFGVAQPTEYTEVLTVEGGGVNSTCVQADIGATNGVVHIVDKILGIPYQSVYEKVKDDFDLHTTYIVGSYRNDWWNRDMSAKNSNKRFTYFAPSKAAWNKLKIEMPSEYKQLTQGLLPVHGEQVSLEENFSFHSFVVLIR